MIKNSEIIYQICKNNEFDYHQTLIMFKANGLTEEILQKIIQNDIDKTHSINYNNSIKKGGKL